MSFQPATALARGTVARGDHEQKHLLIVFHRTVYPTPKTSPLLGARDNTPLKIVKGRLLLQVSARAAWPTTGLSKAL